jgi:hypothetical protein
MWVGEWALRIFVAIFPLVTFLYLISTPVVRPGGVLEALPDAMLLGLAVAVPVTLLAAGGLALRSAARGRDHSRS